MNTGTKQLLSHYCVRSQHSRRIAAGSQGEESQDAACAAAGPHSRGCPHHHQRNPYPEQPDGDALAIPLCMRGVTSPSLNLPSSTPYHTCT